MVTKKTFAACVARAYHPGTKFDSIPVLDGAQGIGKSTLIKYLAGEEFFSDNLSLTDMNDKTAAEKIHEEFFSDNLSLTDMNDKTAAEKIQGNWLIEIGELSGMKKADIEKVKSFVSTTDDKYRASYGRVVESHPRQCVIFATVNGDGRGYLRDITGNRLQVIVDFGLSNAIKHSKRECGMKMIKTIEINFGLKQKKSTKVARSCTLKAIYLISRRIIKMKH